MSTRSEEHTSELQSRLHLVCRLLLEKKTNKSSSRILTVRWPHRPRVAVHSGAARRLCAVRIARVPVVRGATVRERPLLFFFNDTATTEIYTLSLHDALPIWEFPADFALIEPGAPLPESELAGSGERDVGWMLDDIEYTADQIGRAHV